MKIRSMLRSPKFLAIFPLILTLLLSVACGGDAATPPPATAAPTSTPQPTATPQPTLDFAALAQQFGSQVQRDIASQIAGIEFPEGLTAEDVQNIVASAISNIPEGLTPEDVQAIVTQAISQIPEGLTAAQMEAAIKTAVDEGVQRAVSEAVAQIPPTATPEPTPDESMMMMGPATPRLIVATVLDVESNDPVRASSENQPQTIHMYETLVRYDAFGQLQPMLAASWEANSDSTTWTFKLQEGVEFHKGFGGFTTQDVVSTLIYEARDASTSTRKDLWNDVVIPNLEIADDYTIVFNLDRPTTNLDWILSNRNTSFILSKDHLDTEGYEAVERNPIGTGPYQYVERSSGSYVLHERVPGDHWRVHPDFDEIQMLNVKEPSTRLGMILSDQIHLTQLSSDQERAALGVGKVVIQAQIPARLPYMIFGGQFYPDQLVGKRVGSSPDLPFSDVYHPATEVPWVNKKVRQALNKAVNRQAILDTILGGRGKLLYNFPFPEHQRGYDPVWEERFEEMYGYDPERAKELLKEAEEEIGQPLDWSKVTFVIGPAAEFPEGVEMTQAIYNYWEAIGVPVETEIVEHASRSPIHRAGSWGGAAWMDATAVREEPSSIQIYIYSGRQERNFCCHFFENDRADTLFEELVPEVDLNRRHEILQEIGSVVYDEFGFLPLFSLSDTYVVDPNVIAEYETSGIHGIRDLEYIVAVKK